ncbi:MAG: hypothetical protein ACP5D2_00790 [Candidatus Nanoarchaeia archaeon]
MNNKHSFWEALIITIFIFGIGILIGLFIENSRSDEVSEMYLKSQINLLDVQLQSQLIERGEIDCDYAVESNINFGDRIYQEAKKLTRYESASRITDSLIQQHRRYDLLRTLFWVNSINIKEECNHPFHTIVYLYSYEPDNSEKKQTQAVFSRYLEQLKQEKGNEIVLIPIATNLDITYINLLMNKYNITSEELPLVLVDENDKVRSIDNLKDIQQLI